MRLSLLVSIMQWYPSSTRSVLAMIRNIRSYFAYHTTAKTTDIRRFFWLALPLLLLMLGQLFARSRHLLLPKKPILPVEPTTDFAQQAKRTMTTATNGDAELGIATVASGCFWGTEHIYREHYGKEKGLLDAKVGYIGGKDSSKDPSYQEVCSGRTGHAEALQLKYDPSVVTYAELIEFFFRSHDPTQLNAQGNDRGTQYRSAIFPHDANQTSIVKKVMQEVQEKHFDSKGKKLATTIEERPVSAFFVAESYHQSEYDELKALL
jgi:peptide-methionine (S)-S-oxide reductase